MNGLLSSPQFYSLLAAANAIIFTALSNVAIVTSAFSRKPSFIVGVMNSNRNEMKIRNCFTIRFFWTEKDRPQIPITLFALDIVWHIVRTAWARLSVRA